MNKQNTQQNFIWTFHGTHSPGSAMWYKETFYFLINTRLNHVTKLFSSGKFKFLEKIICL